MQTDKAERIQQLTDAALQQLSDALAAGQSEALKRYLTAMAKFHRYSFGNQLLIAFQRPDATHVAGYQTWKKLGRYVKAGEKGILIIAPVTRRVAKVEAVTVPEDDSNHSADTDVRCVVGFTGAYVFDISQTDGQPFPEFAAVAGDPADYTARLKSLVAERQLALEFVSDLGGAQGMSSGGKILVPSGLQPAVEFSVLVHEFAHELLHRGERRHQVSKKVRETEAEAVAFVVCHAIGLDTGTAASDYIQLYRGDRDTLAESLTQIRDTASEIITAIQPRE